MSTVKRLLRAFQSPGSKQECLNLLSSFPDPSEIKNINESKDDFNVFLIHYAAKHGWTDVVQLLVTQYKCDPSNSIGLFRYTALHYACIHNNPRLTTTVEYLTTQCCLDPLQEDRLERTPLFYSKGEIKQYLLKLIDDAKKKGYGKKVVDYLKRCRDLKHEAAIAEAMREGGGELFLSNIILHGPPGAGKSSLKGVILGQPPPPKAKQNATNVLEKSVRTVRINRVTSSATAVDNRQFEIVDNEQIIERLAGEVEKYRQENAENQMTIPSESSSWTNTSPSYSLAVYKSSSAASSVASVDSPSTNKNTSEEVLPSKTAKQFIKEKLISARSSCRMFDSHWHHYVDSGGQPQFLDVLPLLYRSPSHFIVVMRLTEELDDKPKIRFYSQGNDVYELPDHLGLTNREMIVRTCQIAQSIGHATSGKFVPRVFVMGTHIDRLWFPSWYLPKLNKELEPIYKIYSDVMIRKSAEEFIFPVNAMSKGKKRQQYTEEIQQHILSATERFGDPVHVPLKWLMFHLEIDKGEGVVRMSECYQVGEKLGISTPKVHLALEFLNQAALILYYPDDVPDLVLTKMDPFTNRLSRLIKTSFIPPDNGPERESIELRQKGVFTKSFLKRAFQGVDESLISNEEFLKLLESLKVAVHIEGEKYFLPSALSLEPPSPEESSFKSGPIPLALSWGELILPHGFFLMVAVELLQKSRGKDDHVFELRRDKAQWRGEVQVSEAKRKIPGVVKLSDKTKWIQVSYSSDGRYCSIVHSLVDEAVQRAIKRFQHTGIGSPIMGYLCPLCEENDHYCVLSGDRLFVTCSQNDSKTGPVTPDMLLWITEGGRTVLTGNNADKGIKPFSTATLYASTGTYRTPAAPRPQRTPQLKDVYPLLKSKSYEWQKIGQDLGVDYGYRESLFKQGIMRSDDEKLEAVLNNWIETHNSDVSWDNLIQVLTELEFIDVVREVKQYLTH